MTGSSYSLNSESEYDVRARHPDRHVYYQEFVRRSQNVRRSCKAPLDISYGRSEREWLDVFPSGNLSPTVIFIHGGFWQAHDKSEFSFVSSPFTDAGITTVVINYDRAPVASLLDLIAQVQNCCVWIHRHAGDIGVDPGRIYVCGHSAGAHLSGAILTTDWKAKGLPFDLVMGACLVSGLFDLAPLRDTEIGDSVGLDEDAVSMASPLQMLKPSDTKLIVAVGRNESDAFIAQSEAMIRAWQRTGNAGELQILDGLNHYDTALALGDGEKEPLRSFIDIIWTRRSLNRSNSGES